MLLFFWRPNSIWKPVVLAQGNWSAQVQQNNIWTPATPGGGTWLPPVGGG